MTITFILFANFTLHSFQSYFINNKLQALASYRSHLQEILPDEHEILKKQKNLKAHRDRISLDYPLRRKSRKITSCSSSYRQNHINVNRQKQLLNELQLVYPIEVCKIIEEYARSSVMYLQRYKVCNKPIVGMYPLNNSHIFVLAREVEDKELSIFLLDTKHNVKTIQSIDEWDRWKKNLVKEPNTNSNEPQFFIDFDQLDEAHTSVAIDYSKMFIWNNRISYEHAISQGNVTKIGNRNKIMHNRINYYVTVSAKLTKCGHFVITGDLDGLIQVVDATTGDKSYVLTHNKNIVSLGIGLDDSLFIGSDDGVIDMVQFPYTEAACEKGCDMPRATVIKGFGEIYQPRYIRDNTSLWHCFDCFAHTKDAVKSFGQCCMSCFCCIISLPRFFLCTTEECCYCTWHPTA